MTDERDIRDSALDAVLRAHSAETPPPALDAAILAAAHRAVDPGPRGRPARATQPWRWWMPLAAAAVIGVVVVGIVPLAPTLVGAPAPTPERAAVETAPARSEKPRESIAARPDPPQAPPQLTKPRDAVEEAPSRPKTVAAAPALPQAGSARALANRDAAASLQSRVGGSDAVERSIASSSAAAPAADAPASAAASKPDAPFADRRARQSAHSLSADEWIAQIRTLRNDGRMAEAARALRDFRTAFSDADTRLPEDLRAWAKTLR